MKLPSIAILTVPLLYACSPDAVTASATAAKVEADAAKQSLEDKARIEQKVREIQEAQQKQAAAIGKADETPPPADKGPAY